MRVLSKGLICAVTLAGLILGHGTPAAASAANIYIAQSAAGSADGSSCGNAYAYTFFNTSANWGGGNGQIGPGTTVHLCGTFTAGSPNTTMLTVQGSGANGNRVTVLFEANAQLSSPAWNVKGAINLNNKSYVTIDGGTNGSIIATANGTGLSYQQASHAISNPSGAATHDITIHGLTLNNIYHYAYNGSDVSTAQQSGCISLLSLTVDVSLYNNMISNCGQVAMDVIGNSSSTTSNWTIYGNDLSEAVWFVDISGASNTLLQSILIHDNKLHDWDQDWDAADAMHADPIFVRCPSSGCSYSDVYIYNNSFYGNASSHTTGYIFFSYTGSGTSYVFNNTFRVAQAVATNGSIAIPWTGCGTLEVFNNTFDESLTFGNGHDRAGNIGTAGGGLTPSVVTWRNNLGAGLFGFDLASGTLTSDHNVWYNVSVVGPPNQAFKVDPNYYYYSPSDGIPNWQGLGYDSHSVSGNPNLSSTDQLGSGSSAIGAGTNLTSLCNSDSNLAPLCLDKAGMSRPASGAWDAGAYQHAVGRPNPPTNLSATPSP